MCGCNCQFDRLSFSVWRAVALETFARPTAALKPSHLICCKIIADQYEPMALNQNDSVFRSRNKHWHIYCGLPLIGFAFKKLVFLLNQVSKSSLQNSWIDFDCFRLFVLMNSSLVSTPCCLCRRVDPGWDFDPSVLACWWQCLLSSKWVCSCFCKHPHFHRDAQAAQRAAAAAADEVWVQ